jgi:hypothetical protein
MSRVFRAIALAVPFALLPAATLPTGEAPLESQQDPAASAAVAQVFEIPAGRHSLRDLLERAARFLGQNHLLGDVERTDHVDIELQTPLSLDREGCSDVISQLAWTRGLVKVPLDAERGIWEWISANGPRRSEIASRPLFLSPTDVLEHPTRYVPVLTWVPLDHLDAQRASNALRPFMASSSSQVVVGNTGNDNAILLQGMQYQVAALIRILREADADLGAKAEKHGLIERIERLEAALRDARKKD